MTNAQIRVGNAPVSWGVIENVEGERGGYARVLDEMHLRVRNWAIGALCLPIPLSCVRNWQPAT